jgi:alpha-tubulin suppressor-like RCC1 family protein
LRSDAQVVCFGSNVFGQLGQTADVMVQPAPAHAVPTVVPGFAGAVSIATGSGSTCAVMGDGSVRCVGMNASGRFGFVASNMAQALVTTPVTVAGLSGVTQVALGDEFLCALSGDGTAKCLGSNVAGQLGIGLDATPVAHPNATAVTGLVDVVRLAAGPNRMCAIRSDQSLWCWGARPRLSPLPLAEQDTRFPQVSSLAIGATHRCVVAANAAVTCQGDGYTGALGAYVSSYAAEVPDVGGFNDVREISSGVDGTCVRRADGTVWCWGPKGLGIDQGVSYTVPFAAEPHQVSGITATQITAADATACALTPGGGVKCWGLNTFGQLGVSEGLGSTDAVLGRLGPRSVSL